MPKTPGPKPAKIDAGLIHRIMGQATRVKGGCLIDRNRDGRFKVNRKLWNTQRLIGLWHGCPENYQVTSTCGERRCLNPNHVVPKNFTRHTFTPKPREIPTADQMFFCWVRKSTGCWTWTGKRNAANYGIIYENGKYIGAHRWSFRRTNNFLPQVVRHTCDNPPCVNPSHLLPGTMKENAQDRETRERSVWHRIARKERPPMVRQIRCALFCDFCQSLVLKTKSYLLLYVTARHFCNRTCRNLWQKEMGKNTPWVKFSEQGMAKKGQTLGRASRDTKGVYRRTVK